MIPLQNVRCWRIFGNCWPFRLHNLNMFYLDSNVRLWFHWTRIRLTFTNKHRRKRYGGSCYRLRTMRSNWCDNESTTNKYTATFAIDWIFWYWFYWFNEAVVFGMSVNLLSFCCLYLYSTRTISAVSTKYHWTLINR